MLAVAAAALVRLAAWAWVPGDRFASDEQGYVEAGLMLAASGQQDLFWPPLTGWIVALVKWIAPGASLETLRLLWIAIDLTNVWMIGVLAARVGRAVLPDRVERFALACACAYALYLPAISHSQFVTSEMPALALVLGSLVVLTSDRVAAVRDMWAGALLGTLLLARANLLPLLVLLPAASYSHLPRSVWMRRTLSVAVIGAVIVGAAVIRNRVVYGESSLSRNAAYNLYIGNRDLYAEDLDLFRPRATPEQIEFRRQMAAGTLQYPTGTAAELQRAAVQWIVEHPAQFLRRATGRLARVFAPKTDVLELAGGEGAVGVFSPSAVTLLVLANVQWTAALFAGLFGLCVLFVRDRRLGLTFAATIAGSVLLCLIAISKPRYSFVFDPLLIVTAVLVFMLPAAERRPAWRHARLGLAPVYAFLAWGWIAWTIFAVSSRLAA
jgi:hypothetical protein